MNNEKYQLARQTLCKFLKTEADKKNITQQMIAEKTGFKQQNVSRMLNGLYAPSLDNFIRLADAIGVNFFMESKDSQVRQNYLRMWICFSHPANV